MHPHSKQRPLFLTPRSPWGRLPLKRTAQHHMRASEDKKPDPTAKDMQGLGGQMAPNQPGGSNGQQAQAAGNVWQVPHTDPQSYQVPQQPKPAQPANGTNAGMLAQAVNPAQGPMTQQQMRPYNNGGATFTPPKTEGPIRKLLNHVDGELEYEGRHPGTDELPGKSATIRFSTNSNARGELPEYGPEAAEARKKKEGVKGE